MKRLLLAIVVSATIGLLAACDLPLGTVTSEACFERTGFMEEEMSRVSCLGPHDFSTAEARAR